MYSKEVLKLDYCSLYFIHVNKQAMFWTLNMSSVLIKTSFLGLVCMCVCPPFLVPDGETAVFSNEFFAAANNLN